MNNKLVYPFVIALSLLHSSCSSDDESPEPGNTISFGEEIPVTITGLSFDAMEPFISPDGNNLFFNNLNDGINTKIFYAERVNDSVFTYLGELTGTNQEVPPHLDGVPDIDADNNFYWTSTRDYPAQLDNLFFGTFNEGAVENIGRAQGDFYKNIPGWLVMDHGISTDGQLLYFNNARFDDQNCVGPCETTIGIAQKTADGTFMTLPESSSILENINDTNYIYYAPHISSDGLELYYTRYLKGTLSPQTAVEICVALRSEASAPFAEPTVLFSDVIAAIVEAPTLNVDKSILYYHQKEAGTHRIMMRYRSDD